jgi:hypothetical protein
MPMPNYENVWYQAVQKSGLLYGQNPTARKKISRAPDTKKHIEVVVDAFLKDKISFLGMSDVIEQTMGKVAYIKEPTYEDYVDTDAEARRVALSLLSS